DEWVEMDRVKGGATIPSDTVVYMNFDDEYYVLMDHLYAYNSVEDGVKEKNESLEKTTYLNTAAGGGWETLTSFYPREGTEYQFWSLESRNPLIDVDSEESKALLLKELGLGQKCRWLEDGYYVPMEEGQSPYAPGRYYRAPSQLGLLDLRAAGALSDDPSTRGAADLFYVQSFLASQAMSDSGYYPTQVQDDRLYAEYGIKYGYMDLEENAWFGTFLVNAWDAAEEPVIKEKIERLSAFFADYIEAHGKTVSAGGKEGIVVPAYWLEKGDIVSGEASDAANSLLATFLKEAGRILENDSYADLAGSLEAGSLALMMGGKVTF
ncbi:MAG: hypothetical protein K5981_04735, partial [Clostridia bacterium]|nr:hypothetical protein [Clostridia bacterium]